MPGPTPSTSPDRQRRPARDIPWTDVEPTPRPGRPPTPPKWAALTDTARAWWAWAWKLPIARLWGDHEVPMVVRRAQLEADWQTTGNDKVLAEMRHLEGSLLLTAKARKEARVRFVNGEPADEAPTPTKDDLADRRAALAAKRAG